MVVLVDGFEQVYNYVIFVLKSLSFLIFNIETIFKATQHILHSKRSARQYKANLHVQSCGYSHVRTDRATKHLAANEYERF